MNCKRVILFSCFLVFFSFLRGQSDSVYKVFAIGDNILIDGELNEGTWKKAVTLGNFYQTFPYDTSFSISKTYFKLAYDENHLFVAIICKNRSNREYVVQSLKRDFSVSNTDAVILSLAPFGDGQNGFSFGVNPANSQREGVIENGGNFGVTTSWDQVWYSATKDYQDSWIVEMKIPFKSIRFNAKNKHWQFNISRIDMRNNETSCWRRVPRNFNVSSIAFMGKLEWDIPPKAQGPNIVAIPYQAGGYYQKNTRPNSREKLFGIGGDMKVALTTALNLDLTINPDFAQVDVDDQQINLTRFNLFFPERRQFFLENSDLFSNFGFRQIRPFFSRAIGLKDGRIIPILGGARVTGKLGKNWRLGAMNVASSEDTAVKAISKNYTAIAFQRKVFSSSNIAGIFVNDANGIGNDFGSKASSIGGLEFNLLSKNNKHVGKVFYQKSFYENVGKASDAHASFYKFRNIFWDAEWNHEFVGKNFRAPLGFVPRIENFDFKNRKLYFLSYWRLEPILSRTFYPKSKVINNYTFQFYNSSYFNENLELNEMMSYLRFRTIWQNTSQTRITLERDFVDLYYHFRLPRVDSLLLPGKYNWNAIALGFTSDVRRKLAFVADASYGSYYTHGRRANLTFSGNFRHYPKSIFSLNYRIDRIDFPGQKLAYVQLLGVKADVTFTTLMYLTTYFQYNTQSENINLNIRYQWRFMPMSDLFVVYSQNDSAYDLKSIDRRFTLKIVYWLGIKTAKQRK